MPKNREHGDILRVLRALRASVVSLWKGYKTRKGNPLAMVSLSHFPVAVASVGAQATVIAAWCLILLTWWDGFDPSCLTQI